MCQHGGDSHYGFYGLEKYETALVEGFLIF